MPPRFFPALLAKLLMLGGCQQAEAGCFVSGTALPDRRAVLTAPDLGGGARDLMTALFDRDHATLARLLAADPALVKISAAGKIDPLTVAIAACDREAVDLLLARGALPDGANREVPLSLALRATDPWFADRLLDAGASPDPIRDDYDPLAEAIALNSRGAVRLLLDHGANVNHAGRLGDRPLHAALDMERYGLAELLLDRGAEPWAIDAGGASFGHAVAQPLTRPDPDEDAARLRLLARAKKLGWPDPAPDARAVRALALAGKWPPTKAKGTKPLDPTLLEKIKAR